MLAIVAALRKAVAIVVVAATTAGTAFHVWYALHAEGDAIAHEIDFGNGDLHFLSDLDHFAGVSDKLIAELADVDEPVLVHSDIDEGAEGCDVGDYAWEFHAYFEIGGFIDSFGKGKHLELFARVAPWFGKFGDDVFEGRQADLGGDIFFWFDFGADFGLGEQILQGAAEVCGHLFDQSIAFGVNGG